MFDARQCLHDLTRRTHESFAGGREQHPFANAMKERGAEALFDVVELMAERGGREVQHLRRCSNTASDIWCCCASRSLPSRCWPSRWCGAHDFLSVATFSASPPSA